MAKFKAGDRVRRIKGEDDADYGMYRGREFEVESESGNSLLLRGIKPAWDVNYFELVQEEKVAGPTNFILQYELDQDPFETFSTMKEVEARIKELAKRSDLKKDSIKVYEISKTYEVKLETRVLFSPKVTLKVAPKKKAPKKK